MKTVVKFFSATLACLVLSFDANAATVTGFLSGEQKSGNGKICYYDTPYGTKAINVGAYDYCPYTYKFFV